MFLSTFFFHCSCLKLKPGIWVPQLSETLAALHAQEVAVRAIVAGCTCRKVTTPKGVCTGCIWGSSVSNMCWIRDSLLSKGLCHDTWSPLQKVFSARARNKKYLVCEVCQNITAVGSCSWWLRGRNLQPGLGQSLVTIHSACPWPALLSLWTTWNRNGVSLSDLNLSTDFKISHSWVLWQKTLTLSPTQENKQIKLTCLSFTISPLLWEDTENQQATLDAHCHSNSHS